MKHPDLVYVAAAIVGLYALGRRKQGAGVDPGNWSNVLVDGGHPGLSPTFGAPATPGQVQVATPWAAPPAPIFAAASGPAFTGVGGPAPTNGKAIGLAAWDTADATAGYAWAGGVAPSQSFADKQGTWNDPRGNMPRSFYQ